MDGVLRRIEQELRSCRSLRVIASIGAGRMGGVNYARVYTASRRTTNGGSPFAGCCRSPRGRFAGNYTQRDVASRSASASKNLATFARRFVRSLLDQPRRAEL